MMIAHHVTGHGRPLNPPDPNRPGGPSGPGTPRLRPGDGFTLIEILVVVSIIAVVAGLVVMGIQRARVKVNITAARLTVESFVSAIENYYQDESVYPGMDLTPSPDENQFPVLFNALRGERKPRGPGGRNSPYIQVKEEQLAVYDADLDQYLPATLEQIRDPETPKYLLDPWGRPYVYRCNKGKKLENFMRNSNYDFYSVGPNGEDDTAQGVIDATQSDDIGNW